MVFGNAKGSECAKGSGVFMAMYPFHNRRLPAPSHCSIMPSHGSTARTRLCDVPIHPAANGWNSCPRS